MNSVFHRGIWFIEWRPDYPVMGDINDSRIKNAHFITVRAIEKAMQ